MENFETSISAVGTLLATILVGAIGGESVPFRKGTLKDFSFLLSSIFLPCMLFIHLAETFTPEALLSTWIFPLASLQSIALGYLTGLGYSRLAFASPDTPTGVVRVSGGGGGDRALYRPLVLLYCMFQNPLTIPLSVMTSVKMSGNVGWFSTEAHLEQAASLCFVYAVPANMLMWSVGAMVVRTAAKKPNGGTGPSTAAVKKEADEDDAGFFLVFRDFLKSLWNPPFVSILLGMAIGLNPWLVELGQTRLGVVWDSIRVVATGTVPCALIILGGNLANAGTHTPTTTTTTTSTVAGNSGETPAALDTTPPATPAPRTTTSPRHSSLLVSLPMRPVEDADLISNPSFTSLHSTLDDGGKEPPVAVTTLLSGVKEAGPPPPHRLVVSDSSAISPSTVLVMQASNAPRRVWDAVVLRLWMLFAPNGIPYRVLLGIPALRLVLSPLLSVLIFHFVWRPLGLVSRDDATAPAGSYRLTWMVLLVEFTAPSAMNTAVLCSLANYIPTTASKLIFYQYSLSAVTMVLWLIFTLWYIG